jgi:hypothetical protein
MFMSHVEASFAHHDQCLFPWVAYASRHRVGSVASFDTYILKKIRIDNTNNYAFYL